MKTHLVHLFILFHSESTAWAYPEFLLHRCLVGWPCVSLTSQTRLSESILGPSGIYAWIPGISNSDDLEVQVQIKLSEYDSHGILFCFLLMLWTPWPKSNLGKKGCILIYSRQLIIFQKSNNRKKPGADAEAEALRNTVYWFAPYALLNQLFDKIQGHLPRRGTFPSGQSPPTSITNHENAHKLAHRPTCWKQVLQLTFPLPRWLWLYQDDQHLPAQVNLSGSKKNPGNLLWVCCEIVNLLLTNNWHTYP